MSDRFPSISPDGLRIAASALPRGGQAVQFVGEAAGEWQPVPVEFDASGGVWLTSTDLLFTRNKPGGAQDGAILRWDGRIIDLYHDPGLEGWSCHNGRFAGWRRSDRLKSITLSGDGHVAGTVDLGDGRNVALGVDDIEIDRGPIGEPRYTGEALVWVKYVDGIRRVFGRRSHGAATEPLSVFPDDEFWPLAVETPRGLYVMTHGHPERGRPLFLRPWGNVHGHIVAHGFTDRPDARAVDGGVLVAYSNLVALQRVVVNLVAPLVDPIAPPPPPPVDPGDPDMSVQDVPNRRDAVEQAEARYPVAWFNCHRDYERQGQPGATTVEQAEEFIRRLAYDLHQEDRRFGLNGKRATSTLSQDALCFRHDDGRESVIDVVAGAGGSSPSPVWSIVGHYRPAGDGQRWIQPQAVSGGGGNTGGGGNAGGGGSSGKPIPEAYMPWDVQVDVLTRFIAGIWPKDRVPEVTETGLTGSGTLSRGALGFLIPIQFKTTIAWMNANGGRAPVGMEWWAVAEQAVAASVAEYRRSQPTP